MVISWIWTAQVHYDIRYQAEDVYHRFVKGLQITLFVYIGAASGNWNLGFIQDSQTLTGLSGRQLAAYGMPIALNAQCKSEADGEIDAAAESFFTIVLAFIASRGLLIGQYAIGRSRSTLWKMLSSI